MHVHPDIKMLRSDLASQLRSQAAMKAALDKWFGREDVAEVQRELSRFADGAAFADLPSLAALCRDHGAASDWIERFCGTLIHALRGDTLGEVPLRHSSNAGFARLQLMKSGGATLSLCSYEPAEETVVPETAFFADCETHEICIAGKANGYFYTRELDCDAGHPATVDAQPYVWNAGDRMTLRARANARHIVAVERSLLLLQISRSPPHPLPSHEIRVSDGALASQVSGDKRASELVMALSVLGALDDARAIGPMVQFARDAGHDANARWEAVRQVLAIDSVRGMKLLGELSARSRDILMQPAMQLQTQLLAAEPALRTFKNEPA